MDPHAPRPAAERPSDVLLAVLREGLAAGVDAHALAGRVVAVIDDHRSWWHVQRRGLLGRRTQVTPRPLVQDLGRLIDYVVWEVEDDFWSNARQRAAEAVLVEVDRHYAGEYPGVPYKPWTS